MHLSCGIVKIFRVLRLHVVSLLAVACNFSVACRMQTRASLLLTVVFRLSPGASTFAGNTTVSLVIFSAIMLHKAPAAFGLSSFLSSTGENKRVVAQNLLIFSLAAPVPCTPTRQRYVQLFIPFADNKRCNSGFRCIWVFVVFGLVFSVRALSKCIACAVATVPISDPTTTGPGVLTA